MSDRRNIIYLYDGSFDGLLTAVFESYYRHEIPVSIETPDALQQNLFCDYYTVSTDEEKSERVSKAIDKKISHTALVNIYETYLSDTKNKERICLEYIRAGFFYGKNVDYRLNVDCVNRVISSVKRIRSEAHQYLGFVRFSELESGIYYSEISPECNILPIISRHFLKRLPGISWVIHDIRRNLCSVCDSKEFILAPTDSVPNLNFSDKELTFRRLWKEFYDTIEIKERHNERCRTSHLPKRFRRHMTEFYEM